MAIAVDVNFKINKKQKQIICYNEKILFFFTSVNI